MELRGKKSEIGGASSWECMRVPRVSIVLCLTPVMICTLEVSRCMLMVFGMKCTLLSASMQG